MSRVEETPSRPSFFVRHRWHLAMVLGVCVYLGFVMSRHSSLYVLGVATYGRWFHDLFAILASNDAVVRGIDPYIPNPLDYYHRPHVYTSWWLELHKLGLTRADTFWLGLSLVTSFLVVAMAGLKPKSWKESAFYLAGLCSSPVLLAVNRANNDLAVFLILSLAPLCLVNTQRTVRLLAVFLVVFAAGLKFFPLAGAVILLAGKDRSELRMRLLVFALVCCLAGVSIAEDFARGTYFQPDVRGLFTFGSVAIPNTLLIAGPWWGRGAWLIGIGAFLLFFAKGTLAEKRERGEDLDRISFIMGSSLLCACFWANMNFSYRLVFSLWMMPYLWRVPGDLTQSAVLRRLALWTRWLLLCVLWMDTFFCLWVNLAVSRMQGANQQAWADRLFLVEQPLIWAFFLCLLAFLADFIRGKLPLLLPADWLVRHQERH